MRASVRRYVGGMFTWNPVQLHPPIARRAGGIAAPSMPLWVTLYQPGAAVPWPPPLPPLPPLSLPSLLFFFSSPSATGALSFFLGAGVLSWILGVPLPHCCFLTGVALWVLQQPVSFQAYRAEVFSLQCGCFSFASWRHSCRCWPAGSWGYGVPHSTPLSLPALSYFLLRVTACPV